MTRIRSDNATSRVGAGSFPPLADMVSLARLHAQSVEIGYTYFYETCYAGPHAVVRYLFPASLMHHRSLVGAAAEQVYDYRYQSSMPNISL
jgi:hypothetical protein